MRSQFEFFMSERDENAFIAAFSGSVDELKKESACQWLFHVSGCDIQFQPSRRANAEICLGRIAIATHFGDKVLSVAPEAERLYKKMRTWLKREYTNRLVAENTTIPGSSTRYKTAWLGPDAAVLSRAGEVVLRSSVSSRVVWKEELNQIITAQRASRVAD